MSLAALIFFFLFAGLMFAAYMGIRRQLMPMTVIAAVAVIGGIILMTLFSLAQGNSLAQALIVGFLLGSVFSIAVLAIAWYFQGNEMREHYMQQHAEGYAQEDYQMAEEYAE